MMTEEEKEEAVAVLFEALEEYKKNYPQITGKKKGNCLEKIIWVYDRHKEIIDSSVKELIKM